MLYNSLIFLFLFFPLFLIFYFSSPQKFKNLVLLIFSLLFYSWGEGIYVAILIASIFVDYYAAQLIEKSYRKTGLYLSLSFNIGILFIFKYANFTLDNLELLLQRFGGDPSTQLGSINFLLPLGISFFTFQTMSYTMDVYFGKVKASKKIIDFASYVTMFPQLIAGPIVRYSEIEKQLVKKDISIDNFSEGIRRFIIGLAKKVILANSFAKVADTVFDTAVIDLSSSWCWIGLIAYTFQIYFDFSGYSDMAIGIGRMIGFKFPENFNFPYIARTIREFWRRWHMTLSRWFRDYLYIPLGGSRRSPSRVYYNLFIVFVITGIWHGASWNFLIWGLWHGLFIVIERLGFEKFLSKIPRFISNIYTLWVVTISWVFFRSSDLTYSLSFIKKLFIPSEGNSSITSYFDFFHYNLENILIFGLGLVCSIPLLDFIKNKLKSANIYINSIGFKIAKELFFIVLLIICCAYISTDSYNPFIYFRF